MERGYVNKERHIAHQICKEAIWKIKAQNELKQAKDNKNSLHTSLSDAQTEE